MFTRTFLPLAMVLLVVGSLIAVPVSGATDSAEIHKPPVVDTLDGALDSSREARPSVIIPDRYLPIGEAIPANRGTVYFTPQDENTSVSCLFLKNYGPTGANVGITTWNLMGVVQIDTTIGVPSGELVRICSDTVSTISASWQTVVLVNFTTSSTYARLQLPLQVEVEDGYVAWNGGATYDPLDAVPTLKLRFVRAMSKEVTVAFTPQDENTSVTCMFFYNVSGVSRSVDLETFNLSGSPFLIESITVPAGELVRVCADTVTSVSATWQSVVLANFTTNSAHGILTLPPGVMAEGYIAWAGAVDYDPLLVVPASELRFNSNLIFLDGFDRGDAGEWDTLAN